MARRPISRDRAGIFRRKPSYKLSYRYRWLRLTSHDQVELRKLRKFFLFGLALHHSGLDDNRLIDLLVHVSMSYMSIIFIFDPIPPLNSLRLRTSIDEFSESDCFIFFRFQKTDLHLLCHLLGFPAKVVFDWSGLFFRGFNFAEELNHCSFNKFSLELVHLLRRRVLGDGTIGILTFAVVLGILQDLFLGILKKLLALFGNISLDSML